VAQGLGIPVLLSFHDFYSVCPTVKLLDSDGTFCAGTCTQGARDCTPELWDPIHAPPIKHAYIHTWRDKFRRAFESCDAFVTTSERTRTTILKVYPELDERRFLVVPHGRDFVAFCPPRAAPPELKTLTILVPGNISPAKGRDVIAALAEIDQGRRLQFHLLGEVSPPLAGPGIHNHGRYGRETFAGLATKLNPDIGAVFSIWPETYCHTLTELWAIGLPVAGFDLGAIGERIRGTGAGWLLPQGDIAELYGQLTQIGQDGPGRQRAADCVAAWQAGEGQAWTCSAMASRYKDIFGRLVTERRAFTSAPQPPPDP
jgi:glycosyltransferase involved in cell wall biosynthesis